MEQSSEVYVAAVECNGQTDINQFSYKTHWDDVAAMLRIKNDCDDETIFTYTDDEDEYIYVKSQDEFTEALRICKNMNDVIHIQLWPAGTDLQTIININRLRNSQQQSGNASHFSTAARIAMGNTINWAAQAMKTAAKGISHGVTSSLSASVSHSGSAVGCEMNEVPMQDLSHTAGQVEGPVQKTEVESSSRTVLEQASSTVQTDDSTNTSDGTGFSAEGLVIVDDNEKQRIADDNADEKITDGNTNERITDDNTNSEILAERENEVMVDKKLLLRIKQEVKEAVTEELSALKEEITRSTPNDHTTLKNVGSGESGHKRTPKLIKSEIKFLKKELKTVKANKKQNHKREKADHVHLHETTSDVSSDYVLSISYDASMECENLLRGKRTVKVGSSFVKYCVVKNQGFSTWNGRSVTLVLLRQSPSPNFDQQVTGIQQAWGPECAEIVVPPAQHGDVAVLSIRHVAPGHPCKYRSVWRLCAGGKRFGPRIFCCVEVLSDEDMVEMNRAIEQSIGQHSSVHSCLEGFSFDSGRGVVTTSHAQQYDKEDDDYDGKTASNFSSFEDTHITEFVDLNESSFSSTKLEQRDVANRSPGSAHSSLTGEKVEGNGEVGSETITYTTSQHFSGRKSHSGGNNGVELARDDEKSDEGKLRQEAENDGTCFGNDGNDDEELSDFEVIPIPECFDVTRPLIASSMAPPTDPTSPSNTAVDGLSVSSTTNLEQKTCNDPEANDQSQTSETTLDYGTPSMAYGEQVGTKLVFDQTSMSLKQPISGDNSDVPLSPTSSADPSATTNLTSSLGHEAQESHACPLPFSVLNADTAYVIPVQLVAPEQPAWLPQPIPLPRSVTEMDQPWTGLPCPRPPSTSTTTRPLHGSQPTAPTTLASSSSLPITGLQLPPQQARRTGSPNLSANDLLVSDEIATNPEEDDPETYYPPSEPADLDQDFVLAPQHQPITSPQQHDVTSPQQRDVTTPQQHDVSNELLDFYNLDPLGSSLQKLVEMGFADRELNIGVLREFDGDVTQAVNALVSRVDDVTVTSLSHHDRRRRGDDGFLA